MISPSTVDFRAIVSTGDVPGSDVILKDIKAAEVIWGQSILKMKGITVRNNGKWIVQSIIKVPKLIKLHQDVELAIDIFLSTNKSSSQLTAQRCFSTVAFCCTMRKNISGEFSGGHIICTFVKASISL
jgi:hypothetical protein